MSTQIPDLWAAPDFGAASTKERVINEQDDALRQVGQNLVRQDFAHGIKVPFSLCEKPIENRKVLMVCVVDFQATKGARVMADEVGDGGPQGAVEPGTEQENEVSEGWLGKAGSERLDKRGKGQHDFHGRSWG